jgi:8-oxo-dGTP pyrophosphatase MutT (NUDIX family)
MAADGRWIDHGDSVIYDSPWVRLVTTDVSLPDGTRIDHHVVRLPLAAAGTIVVRDGMVLLLWRHRFITETWGWEIPAGGIDPGESAADAAIRETIEETGWRPDAPRHLCSFHPANGVLDQTFHIFVSTGAEYAGPPTDTNEAARIEWLAISDVRELYLSGSISDGLSFGALGFALTAGVL